MKRFVKLANFLKSSLEFDYPVYIRKTKLPKDRDGDCQLKNNYFLIRISKDIPEYYALDCLVHEFSHCIAWNSSKTEHHDAKWGVAYSKVYRKFLEWLECEKT